VLAYEVFPQLCEAAQQHCTSTKFRSLTSGKELAGFGLQMSNPAWSGDRVVGVVAGGVSITGPNASNEQVWFSYGSNTVPSTAVGTRYVEAASASADGTRLAVLTTADANGDRALWLLTGGGLGQPVTPACAYSIRSSAAHVAWAPDGSAIAVQTTYGVSTIDVVDLSGTSEGCDANLATAKLIVPGATYPAWSQAPYQPAGQGAPGNRGPGTSGPWIGGRAPSLRIGSPSSLREVVRDGIGILLTCPVGCTVSALARVDAQTARRYRLGPAATIIARTMVAKVPQGNTHRLTLRLTTSARRRLRTAHHLTITIRGTLREDPFGLSVWSRKLRFP
jgi:hypothetical protein